MSTDNTRMDIRGNQPVTSQPGNLDMWVPAITPAEERVLEVARSFAETLDSMLRTISAGTENPDAMAVGVDGLSKGQYAAAVTARESGPNDYFRLGGWKNITYELAVGIVERAGKLPRSPASMKKPKDGCALNPAYVVKFQFALLPNQGNALKGLTSPGKTGIDELLAEVAGSAEAAKTGEARINQTLQPRFKMQPGYTANAGEPAALYNMRGPSRTTFFLLTQEGAQQLVRALKEANSGALPRMETYQQMV